MAERPWELSLPSGTASDQQMQLHRSLSVLRADVLLTDHSPRDGSGLWVRLPAWLAPISTGLKHLDVERLTVCRRQVSTSLGKPLDRAVPASCPDGLGGR